MKKILTLLFLHFSFFAFAQDSFGVKGGLNVSNVASRKKSENFSKYDLDTDNDVGFHTGVYAKIKLMNKVSFVPELQYTRRGLSTKYNPMSNEKTHLRYGYLELPLLVSYAPLKWLAVDVGPSVAYMIAASSKTGTNKINTYESYDDHRIDFGLNGGARFHVTEKISVIGRYYFGLSVLSEVTVRELTNINELIATFHNRSAQFGVSYHLN